MIYDLFQSLAWVIWEYLFPVLDNSTPSAFFHILVYDVLPFVLLHFIANCLTPSCFMIICTFSLNNFESQFLCRILGLAKCNEWTTFTSRSVTCSYITMFTKRTPFHSSSSSDLFSSVGLVCTLCAGKVNPCTQWNVSFVIISCYLANSVLNITFVFSILFLELIKNFLWGYSVVLCNCEHYIIDW